MKNRIEQIAGYLMHVTACIGILALCPASVMSALPTLGESEKAAAQQIAAFALPSSEEQIDKVISQLNARSLDIRRQISARTLSGTEGAVSGAAPEEFAVRERLLNDLLITVDKHVRSLQMLKGIRAFAKDRTAEMQGWRGGEQKPPFSLSVIEGVQEAILAEKIEIEKIRLRMRLAGRERDTALQGITGSEKNLRLAEEAYQAGIGSASETPRRRQRDLARLQNDYDKVLSASAETRRLVYEEVLASRTQYLQFLEEKLTALEKVSPLTREFIEEKRGVLARHDQKINQELLHAVQRESDLQKRLQQTRAELQKTQALLSASPTEKLKSELKTLEASLNTDLAVAATYTEAVEIFKGMHNLNAVEVSLWEDRYWLTRKPSLAQLNEKADELMQKLDLLKLWNQFVQSNLVKWASLLDMHRSRAAEAGSAPMTMPPGKDQLLLKSYEDRYALLIRLADKLAEANRLADILESEIRKQKEGGSFAWKLQYAYSLALKFLNELWSTELYVADESVVVEGTRIQKPISVTIAKVVKALLILVAGTMIVRWLMKPFDWACARWTKLSRNGAEQIGKVMFMIMFCCLLVFSLVSVNIPLAVFTFLGGALAIGIGFGAQNLLNNFISGLILMFDRSISVGDIVEIDGQGGRVTTIGMRSSLITRFDGVELLVPNSQFLQQKVTNWTHSTKKMRYSITVGVSYGSPTEQVAAVLLAAVEKEEHVLQEPPPVVLFEDFAESTLNFTVNFWLELASIRDNRVLLSTIRHRIVKLFDEAGIVIAFPQQDVHIDAQKPLPVRVVPAESA